jgi:hypothetical protein
MIQNFYNDLCYSTIYSICTGYTLSEEFETKICEECDKKLIECYLFKKLCDKSEQILADRTKKIETEHKEILEDIDKSLVLNLKVEEFKLEDHNESVFVKEEQIDDDLTSESFENSTQSHENDEPSEHDSSDMQTSNNLEEVGNLNKNIVCEFCSKSFHKTLIDKHIHNLHPDDYEEWKQNTEGNKMGQDLEEQVEKSSKIQHEVECEFCSKSVRERTYNSHIRLCHPAKYRSFLKNKINHDLIPVPRVSQEPLEQNKVQCSFCPNTMLRKSMVRHLRDHHYDEILLNEEALNKSDATNFSCKHCESFPLKSSLNHHIQKKHKELYDFIRVKTQKDKSMSIEDKIEAENEKKRSRVRPSPLVLCQFCGIIVNRGHLRIHLESMGNGTIYSCNSCDRKFTKKNSLITHQLTHKDTMFPCRFPPCTESFRIWMTRRNHEDKCMFLFMSTIFK